MSFFRMWRDAGELCECYAGEAAGVVPDLADTVSLAGGWGWGWGFWVDADGGGEGVWVCVGCVF